MLGSETNISSTSYSTQRSWDLTTSSAGYLKRFNNKETTKSIFSSVRLINTTLELKS
jgi:hypothetical protein